MGRVAPSPEVELQVLLSSRRRCCLCYGLHGDLRVKQGQLAHLDRNPANSSADNLAFMCLEHHDWFDTKPSQSKRATPEEAKHYREKLYDELRRQDQDEANAEAAATLPEVGVAVAVPDEGSGWRRALPPEQIAILRALAAAVNDGQEQMHLTEAIGRSGLSAARFKNHADQLDDLGYLGFIYYSGGPSLFLDARGARWLEENGHMPE